jgi:hypothetical protein
MTRILTVDDAWDGQWIGIDGIGRRSVLTQALPANAVAPDWASVLAAGALSGGNNPTISAGDELEFLGVGMLEAPASIQTSISGLTRFTVSSTGIVVNGAAMAFAPGVASPSVTQNGSNGSDLSVIAQEGTVAGGRLLLHAGDGLTGAGGDLVITPGTGGGGAAQGSVLVRHANNDIAMRVSQAAAHLGTQAINITGFGLGFFDGTPTTRPIVAGAKGGNAALTSLLGVLDAMGLITDNTT